MHRGPASRRGAPGEIDHLLIGPRGLVAIEGKHRNATVHCAGDHWWYTKFDSAADISKPECAKLERLIVRDHRFHSGRRRS